MPWSGGAYSRTDGVYNGTTVWQQNFLNGVKIQTDRHDTHDQDLATGINFCIPKDGSASTTMINLVATVNASTGTIQQAGAPLLWTWTTQSLFLGIAAGNFGSSGTLNTGLGSGSLAALTTGNRNTGVGRSALPLVTTASDNTGLGNGAGFALTTGAQNTFIGASAGNTPSSGSQNIVLGYLCDVPSATNSGQMSLGNIIYGFANTGTGSTPSTGRIVIGSNVGDDGVTKFQVAGGIIGTTVANGIKVLGTVGATATPDWSAGNMNIMTLTNGTACAINTGSAFPNGPTYLALKITAPAAGSIGSVTFPGVGWVGTPAVPSILGKSALTMLYYDNLASKLIVIGSQTNY
jgi:hypothetical protein